MKTAVEKIYDICFDRKEIQFQTKVYLLMAVVSVFTIVTAFMITIA